MSLLSFMTAKASTNLHLHLQMQFQLQMQRHLHLQVQEHHKLKYHFNEVVYDDLDKEYTVVSFFYKGDNTSLELSIRSEAILYAEDLNDMKE